MVTSAEYIVSFNGYYKTSTRSRYIAAALKVPGLSWTVVARVNPAFSYPSDFDVVQVTVTVHYYICIVLSVGGYEMTCEGVAFFPPKLVFTPH